jgi:cation diffusion facilitator family transporter
MSESTVTVIAAIAVNAVIALAKYIAAVASGSAAMLAEAIHSTVDTGNEALLLLGLRRSQKPADLRHPFGYGQELYFWSLVVAVVIFGLGGGAAMLEGIWRVLQPHPLENLLWNYIVLSIALVFEAISWTIAYRAVRSDRPGLSILQAVRSSKDPSRFVVLLEDTAAIAGVLIALVLGTFLAQQFPGARLDGIASILIGVILVATAIFLVAETRGLLIGESADPATVEEIRTLAEAQPEVQAVKRILTMHLAPENVLLNLDVHFDGSLDGREVPAVIERIERIIRDRFPEIREIFIETQD